MLQALILTPAWQVRVQCVCCHRACGKTQRTTAQDSICGEAQCTMWHDSVARRCQMVSRVQCVCCHRACGKTQRTTAQDAVIKYSNTPTGEGGKQWSTYW